MRTAARLTVCICVRNGAAHIDACLDALLLELGSAPVDVVVVDHLSTDATPKHLERWNKRCQVYTYTEEGLARARDFAWRQATTAWVGFIDADCRVQPGWLAAVEGAIREHEGDATTAALGGENHVPRGENYRYDCYALLLPTYVGGHGSPLNRPVTKPSFVPHLPTLNVVYRRPALERIGGFDPRFLRVAEDLDVSYRLGKAGFRLRTVPGMRVVHRHRDDVRSWMKNMYLYGRGRTLFMRAHPEAVDAKFLLPALLALAHPVWLAGCLVLHAPFWLYPTLFALHTKLITAGLGAEAVRTRARPHVYLGAAAIVFLTHLAYGFGMLRPLPFKRRETGNADSSVAKAAGRHTRR